MPPESAGAGVMAGGGVLPTACFVVLLGGRAVVMGLDVVVGVLFMDVAETADVVADAIV